MRNYKFGQQYIVNLTKQLFGATVLKSDYRASDPQAMYLVFFEKLKDKVRKMNPETLGIICEFGYCSNKDGAEFAAGSGTFIRKTGIADVHPHPFEHSKPGRELLEEIAIATIVSVAVDICRQSQYEAEREDEQQQDFLWHLGQREYIHRGSKARQL